MTGGSDLESFDFFFARELFEVPPFRVSKQFMDQFVIQRVAGLVSDIMADENSDFTEQFTF